MPTVRLAVSREVGEPPRSQAGSLRPYTHAVILRAIHAHQGSARTPCHALRSLPTADRVGLARPGSGHLSCPVQHISAPPAHFPSSPPIPVSSGLSVNGSPSEHAPATLERPRPREMVSRAQPLIHSHLEL